MKTLLYYCYYKFSKFFDEWDWYLGDKDGHISGSLVLFQSFAFIFLSILSFIFSLYDKKFNSDIIITIFVLCGILSLFFVSKKKYKELEERYKDEKYSNLKTGLVFLYFIGSIALFFVSIFVFKV